MNFVFSKALPSLAHLLSSRRDFSAEQPTYAALRQLNGCPDPPAAPCRRAHRAIRLAIVAAEMLIGGVGIGFFIWDAWNSSHISDIIVALVYVGLVGFVLDRLVSFVGKLVTHGIDVN